MEKTDVNTLKGFLDKWVNHQIMITKEEDGVDRTLMSVHDVKIVERPESIDGYVAPLVVQLHGEGYVIEGNRKVPLPGDRYDIALSDKSDVEMADKFCTIQTERASYTFTLQ